MNPGPTDRFQMTIARRNRGAGSVREQRAQAQPAHPISTATTPMEFKTFSAGTPLSVQIRATDIYWNRTAATAVGNMTLTSTDPNDLERSAADFADGRAPTTVSWTFNTANPAPGWQLTADDGPAARSTRMCRRTFPSRRAAPRSSCKYLLPGEIGRARNADPEKPAAPSLWVISRREVLRRWS